MHTGPLYKSSGLFDLKEYTRKQLNNKGYLATVLQPCGEEGQAFKFLFKGPGDVAQRREPRYHREDDFLRIA